MQLQKARILFLICLLIGFIESSLAGEFFKLISSSSYDEKTRFYDWNQSYLREASLRGTFTRSRKNKSERKSDPLCWLESERVISC